jgi:hypothetical protein
MLNGLGGFYPTVPPTPAPPVAPSESPGLPVIARPDR